ncbi:RHS repeat protein [Actinomadura mexicana]|uniref:YD repeat-containing protein n=1 Tax=Actinomadura mexicana TaxID=134959 RepID=A0A238XGW5_9ACTN|nr:RHS repeat protein [Actinomadura mexicana]SNR57821.1 YD repeat-containing protein [Actinomadura mexicana]
MHGDKAALDGGSKSVTVSDGEGGTHTDAEGLDGFVLKTVNYAGPGGTVHDKTVNVPWRLKTATRTRSWSTVTAEAVQTDNSRTWTAMDGGTWRETKVASVYETDLKKVGRVKQVDDFGDVSTAIDDRCARTEYADNLDKWMVSYESRVETVSVKCGAEVDRSKQLISDVQTYYDQGEFGDAPTKGAITKTQQVSDHDGSKAKYVTDKETTYDQFGRPLTVTNALEQTTTTAYTDTGGLTTKTVTTTPPAIPGNLTTALKATEQLDPAWGLPSVKFDTSNGNLRTDLEYDALGRLTKAWLPNRPKAGGGSPSLEMGYRVAEGQIVAVTTKRLTNTEGQQASVELLDGLLRTRQTQLPGPAGRLISDTFYNSRGAIAKEYEEYSAAGAPQPALFGVELPGDVETQTDHAYDGLGRQTVERLLVGKDEGAQEKWRTTTTYGGNWKAVDPPEGGTATAEFTDARGQIVERREYRGGSPSGVYDGTQYSYSPAGLLTTVKDPSANIWTYTYDLRGRKTEVTDPDAGTSTYTYDDLDRIESTTDARGATVFNAYDGLGRPTGKREGSETGPLLASWTYDTATRGKGKLASSTRHGPNGDYTKQVAGYDVLGRPESTSIDIPGTEGALAGHYTFSQTYNLDGTPKDETVPAVGGLAQETLSLSYDQFQRPTRMAGQIGTYVNATEYTPTGKIKLVEFGAGDKRAWNTLSWEYGTQRLAGSRTYRENVAGNDRESTYKYDAAGNILQISDVSTAGIDTQCFKYDHLRRLTDAWAVSQSECPAAPSTSGGPAPYRLAYTYKLDGSRQKEDAYDTSGTLISTRTYQYKGGPGVGESIQAHRLGGVTQTGDSPFTGPASNTESYEYDAAGNPTTRQIGSSTQKLEWTPEGDLAKVTEGDKTTSFVYDVDGSRLIRRDPTGATLYLPGAEVRAPAGAATAAGTRYYTFGEQTWRCVTPPESAI